MCKNASKNILNIATIGLNALGVALTIEYPGDTNVQKYESDVAILIQQIGAWQPGSSGAEIIQVVDDVQADVKLLPFSLTTQQLIAVALAGLASIVAVINQNSTVGGATQVSSAALMTKMEVDEPAYSGPTAAAYYTRNWNSAVSKAAKVKPELAKAKIPMPWLKELLP